MSDGRIPRRRFLRYSASSAAGIAALQLLPRTLVASRAPHSIGGTAAAHGILAGCAVNGQGLLKDAEFRQLVAAQASIVVAENAMKWRALRPSPTTYDYSAADRLVEFAQQNGMKIRGHNLCWHQSLPDWFASTVTRANAVQFLTSHIQNVAERYAGRIHSWDVVNEAIKVEDHHSDGLRDSPWLQTLGPAYIDIAFRAARAADPKALLVYNDYGIEFDNPKDSEKRGAVLDLVKTLKKHGAPIDAIGVQSHLRGGSNDKIGGGLRHFIREVRKLGLDVYVTELDVDDSHIAGDFSKRDKTVAELYGNYLDLVLAEGVRTVLTWGITNRYSWMSHEHPRADNTSSCGLPFDRNLQPVACFDAMISSFGRIPAPSA